MIFTVEIKNIENYEEGKTEVEINLDKESLKELLHQLTFLKKKGDHLHFMSPEWSGDELTETPQGENTVLINHLKINYTD